MRIQALLEKNQEKLQNLSEIVKFAPFLGTETCDKLFRKFSGDADEKSLNRIVSFVSKEALTEWLKARFAGKYFVDTYALEEYKKRGWWGLKRSLLLSAKRLFRGLQTRNTR